MLYLRSGFKLLHKTAYNTAWQRSRICTTLDALSFCRNIRLWEVFLSRHLPFRKAWSHTHENTVNELYNKSSFLKLSRYLILTKGRWSFLPPLLTTDLAISQHPHYERKNCYRSSLSQSNCSYDSIFFLLWLSSPHTILKMTWQGKHNTFQAVKNLTN